MSEAQRKLSELRAKVRSHVDVEAGRERLGTYLDGWLVGRDEAEELKRSTLADYRDLLDRCIKGSKLAKKPLDEVQPSDVRQWLSTLKRRGTGLRTRQRALALLRAALGAAERDNALAYNPAAKVATPKAEKKNARVRLDREHIGTLLKAAEGSPYEAVIVLAALHGLRIGEALGLCWGDVDLRAGAVTIRRQLAEERRTGERYFAPVKTEAGERTVPLSDLAVAALRRLLVRVGAAPHPGRLLFRDAKGAPLRRSNFHRRIWTPIRDAARLPKGSRFHDLRHAAASALLGAGQDVATVAGVLGHSSPAVTLRVYAHALPNRMREAATAVDALYG
jgi:integrase